MIAASLVGYATLRLIRCEDVPDASWAKEPLHSQAKRALDSLAALAHLPTGDGEENEGETEDDNLNEALPMELFVYSLPLLRTVLVDRPTLFPAAVCTLFPLLGPVRLGSVRRVGQERNVVEETALRFVQLHVEAEEEGGQFPGWLLPIQATMGLLLQLIAERFRIFTPIPWPTNRGVSLYSQGWGKHDSAERLLSPHGARPLTGLLSLLFPLVWTCPHYPLVEMATEVEESVKTEMVNELIGSLLAFVSHPNETAREFAIKAPFPLTRGGSLGLRQGT